MSVSTKTSVEIACDYDPNDPDSCSEKWLRVVDAQKEIEMLELEVNPINRKILRILKIHLGFLEEDDGDVSREQQAKHSVVEGSIPSLPTFSSPKNHSHADACKGLPMKQVDLQTGNNQPRNTHESKQLEASGNLANHSSILPLRYCQICMNVVEAENGCDCIKPITSPKKPKCPCLCHKETKKVNCDCC